MLQTLENWRKYIGIFLSDKLTLKYLPKRHILHNLLHSNCHCQWSITIPIQITLRTMLPDYNKSPYQSFLGTSFYLLKSFPIFYYSTSLYFVSETNLVFLCNHLFYYNSFYPRNCGDTVFEFIDFLSSCFFLIKII